jgi:hypothetical protein
VCRLASFSVLFVWHNLLTGNDFSKLLPSQAESSQAEPRRQAEPSQAKSSQSSDELSDVAAVVKDWKKFRSLQFILVYGHSRKLNCLMHHGLIALLISWISNHWGGVAFEACS